MKQIIILELTPSSGSDMNVRVVFWIPVPQGQERPLPNLSNSAFANASAEEIAALQKGVIIEEVRNYPFPINSTPEVIEQLLQSAYTTRVTFLNSVPFAGKLYGLFFDGNSWASSK